MLQTPHFVVTGLVPVRFVASSLLLDASLEQYRNEKETGKITEKREHREKTKNKRNTDTSIQYVEDAYAGLLFFFQTPHFCVAQLVPIHFVTKWLLLDSFLELDSFGNWGLHALLCGPEEKQVKQNASKKKKTN